MSQRELWKKDESARSEGKDQLARNVGEGQINMKCGEATFDCIEVLQLLEEPTYFGVILVALFDYAEWCRA